MYLMSTVLCMYSAQPTARGQYILYCNSTCDFIVAEKQSASHDDEHSIMLISSDKQTDMMQPSGEIMSNDYVQ